jgi:hypothetical protein
MTLIQYIRKSNTKKGKVIGIMIAFAEDDNLYVGWSLCNPLDRFSKTRGMKIAVDRAFKWTYRGDSWESIPPSVEEILLKFINKRALLYFNDKRIPAWVKNFKNFMYEIEEGENNNAS